MVDPALTKHLSVDMYEALHRGIKRHKVGYLTFLAFRTEPKFEMLQMAMFQNAEEI